MRIAVVIACCLAFVGSCSSQSAAPAAKLPPPTPPPTSAPSPHDSTPLCRQADLRARFAGGGLGTGNDFGTIAIWNVGKSRCRISGDVSFAAYYANGQTDPNAHPNQPVPPVSIDLAAHMAPFPDGAELTGYVAVDLMGPERDDPTRPDALCRAQDKLAPAVLDVRLGRLTFRVANSDPNAVQVKQVYGCHGRVLLEEVTQST
jgi:hypothetical protein